MVDQTTDVKRHKHLVLGLPVDAIRLDDAINWIIAACASGSGMSVFIRDLHGIVRARKDSHLLKAHETATLVTPDGMPVVWLLKIAGARRSERVCGPDLIEGLLSDTNAGQLKHFFYGGHEGVAERMSQNILNKYPGTIISGFCSPPFFDDDFDDRDGVSTILESDANIVWIGLSTPKQELWIDKNKEALKHCVLIGVGAVFDLYGGRTIRAPKWLRPTGFEWVFRFLSEPKRLGPRYIWTAYWTAVYLIVDASRALFV